MHLHIANISINMSNILCSISDISLLSNNLVLEIMNKIKSNRDLGLVKHLLILCLYINNVEFLIFY